MKKVLVKNSIYGLAQTVINLLLLFFTIPVFIKMLGSEAYGVFALMMVVGNLNTFTNLGLTSSLIKFLAEQDKTEESNIDILTNLLLTLMVSLPFTIIAIRFSRFVLLDILKIPLNMFDGAKWLYFWLLLANFLLLVGQVFKSILDARQKIYVTSFQQIFYNIVYWGLILVVLNFNQNLSGVGLAIFVSAFVWFAITSISAIKEWGAISFANLSNGFKKSAKKQLIYGLKIYTSGLIGFFYEPFSKILISNFIGIKEVGFFDIALKLRSQLWGLVNKIFYPLFPFISGQKDKFVIRKYVHDIEQKAFLVIVPLIAIIVLLMHPFVKIWIGENVEIISITAIFIISFHMIGSAVIPNYQFLMAKNLAQKTIILQLSNVIFNALIFGVTVHLLRYYASIAGNVAAIMSAFFLSLYYQKKYLDSLIFDSFSQVLKLIASFFILILLGSIIKMVLDGHNILMIIVIPLILLPITILLYKVFGLVRLEDIHRYFGKHNMLARTFAKIYYTGDYLK